MIKVAVLGAGGRMGSQTCVSIKESDDLELVAAIDPDFDSAGSDRAMAAIVSTDGQAILQAGAQVAVDFTTPQAAPENIKWCLANNIHAVVGTTGISEQDVDEISALADKSDANVLIAPNFAIGAVLMMHFAEQAARWMPEAEIIEMHHPAKLDSPSGTAIKTLEGILRGRARAEAQNPESPQAGRKETLPGARGAESSGVRIHSVRLPGLVAHQEVLLGAQGQTLSIRHDTTDRTSFMPGVLLAIRQIHVHPGLTKGLERLLGI